jgi:hypothetical protein
VAQVLATTSDARIAAAQVDEAEAVLRQSTPVSALTWRR